MDRLRKYCGHVDVGTCPHQVLAATLNLSQSRGADYLCPPYTNVHTKFWKSQARLLLRCYYNNARVYLSIKTTLIHTQKN